MLDALSGEKKKKSKIVDLTPVKSKPKGSLTKMQDKGKLSAMGMGLRKR
jgi:hypothetical protein